MNPARKRRLFWIAAIATVVAGVAFAVIQAFNDNMVFFYTPTQLTEGKVPGGRSYRLGGMVEVGSVQRDTASLKVAFTVTDSANRVPVTYTGIVPDLFKEGTGVVAEGQMQSGVFVAHTILAKHDENYMPPGVKGK